MAYNAFIYLMAYPFRIFYRESKSIIDIPENDFLFGFEFMIFLV